MANSAADRIDVREWILVPALITLAVSLIRLAGELMGGADSLFNREAGGPGALIGIVWLIPIFGVYFGYKLAKAGHLPEGWGKPFGLIFLALIVMVVGMVFSLFMGIGEDPQTGEQTFDFSIRSLLIASVFALAGVFIAVRAWPQLGRVLLAYALAARIPVVIIMFLAIFGDWGTHYDAPPPGYVPPGPFTEWFLTGLIPQLTSWIALTCIFGGLAAVITGVISSRGSGRT